MSDKMKINEKINKDENKCTLKDNKTKQVDPSKVLKTQHKLCNARW